MGKKIESFLNVKVKKLALSREHMEEHISELHPAKKKSFSSLSFFPHHCYANSSSKYVNCTNKVSEGVAVLPKSHRERFLIVVNL